ncbi:Mitochondrial copper homeostasis protein [Entomophthora muscae]|uniref:Mitochondrial copper homeostasis protein n=1 Tax=Entomophthora muscae TaxID=34485 RepID=A0ACC2UNJ2_9FUNG|nr:Mitochondrial copper homeostasis protein [Entomophthora muscae]
MSNSDEEKKLLMLSKQSSQFFDPCLAESKRSMKCLKENGYDKEMCQDFFQEYRDCKKKWNKIRAEERSKHGLFSSWTSKEKTSTDQEK